MSLKALRLVAILAVASGVLLPACGESESEDGRLVTIEANLDFDFRIDPDDGPEHVFSIDTELFLDRDGRGAYTADGEPEEFEATPEQVEDVDQAFARQDMDRLAEEFDAGTDEGGSFTVTYDGKTTEIGAGVLDDGSGSEGAAIFTAAYLLVGSLAEDEGEDSERVERDREQLVECLDSDDPATCLSE